MNKSAHLHSTILKTTTQFPLAHAFRVTFGCYTFCISVVASVLWELSNKIVKISAIFKRLMCARAFLGEPKHTRHDPCLFLDEITMTIFLVFFLGFFLEGKRPFAHSTRYKWMFKRVQKRWKPNPRMDKNKTNCGERALTEQITICDMCCCCWNDSFFLLWIVWLFLLHLS